MGDPFALFGPPGKSSSTDQALSISLVPVPALPVRASPAAQVPSPVEVPKTVSPSPERVVPVRASPAAPVPSEPPPTVRREAAAAALGGHKREKRSDARKHVAGNKRSTSSSSSRMERSRSRSRSRSHRRRRRQEKHTSSIQSTFNSFPASASSTQQVFGPPVALFCGSGGNMAFMQMPQMAQALTAPGMLPQAQQIVPLHNQALPQTLPDQAPTHRLPMAPPAGLPRANGGLNVNGFRLQHLNGDYTKDVDDLVGGKPMYWSQGMRHLLYYQRSAGWAICPRIDGDGGELLAVVKKGGNQCMAYEDRVNRCWWESSDGQWAQVTVEIETIGDAVPPGARPRSSSTLRQKWPAEAFRPLDRQKETDGQTGELVRRSGASDEDNRQIMHFLQGAAGVEEVLLVREASSLALVIRFSSSVSSTAAVSVGVKLLGTPDEIRLKNPAELAQLRRDALDKRWNRRPNTLQRVEASARQVEAPVAVGREEPKLDQVSQAAPPSQQARIPRLPSSGGHATAHDAPPAHAQELPSKAHALPPATAQPLSLPPTTTQLLPAASSAIVQVATTQALPPKALPPLPPAQSTLVLPKATLPPLPPAQSTPVAPKAALPPLPPAQSTPVAPKAALPPLPPAQSTPVVPKALPSASQASTASGASVSTQPRAQALPPRLGGTSQADVTAEFVPPQQSSATTGNRQTVRETTSVTVELKKEGNEEAQEEKAKEKGKDDVGDTCKKEDRETEKLTDQRKDKKLKKEKDKKKRKEHKEKKNKKGIRASIENKDGDDLKDKLQHGNMEATPKTIGGESTTVIRPVRAKWSSAAAEGLQIVAERPAGAWEGTWSS